MSRLTAPMAARHGDRVAISDDRGVESWAELDARVNRLITALRKRGLQPGSALLLMTGNQRETIEVLLACMQAGWLAVPVNRHWVADEVAYLVTDTTADAVIASESRVAVATAALESAGRSVVRIAVSEHVHAGYEDYEELLETADDAAPDQLLFGGPMFYTSGTTGRPKGVRSRLNALGADVEMWDTIAEGLGSGVAVSAPGSVLLLTGPIYHSVQWVYTFGTLLNGSSVVMQSHFDPQQVLTDIDRHQVTHLHLVPTQMIRLLRLDNAARAAFRGDSLRHVFHGAAFCPQWVKHAMIEWWGPRFTEYYGGTEAGFLTSISSAEWIERPTSVGRPKPNVELTIVDDSGGPLPAGEAGIIRFRSLVGNDFEYHNDPEKTARSHPEPTVGTLGDIGWLDDEGYLHLSDRETDMVVSGGVNIYPAEIERVLSEHAAVADLAAFGVPNEEMGETVAVAVETAGGRPLDETLIAELTAFCRERLAGYKCPRAWFQVEQLPRNEIGKVPKNGLRERFIPQ